MESLKPIIRLLRRVAVLGGSVCLLAVWGLAASGAELRTSNPYDLIAANLHKFPAYVQWPRSAAAANTAPWRIGVLGEDPFGDALMQVTKNQPIGGREFEIIHATRAEDLRTCDLVYVGLKDEDKIKQALNTLAGRPILTVSTAENFLQLGGVIRMEIPKKAGNVRFSLNLDQARSSGLKISAEMQELATQILKEGRLRKT